MANRDARLIVRVEQAGNASVKIADKRYTLSPTLQEFSFTTAEIGKPGRYRLAFYVGDNPEGDRIWLDSITLTEAK